MVIVIGDVEVARAVHRHAIGIREPGAGGRAAVALVASHSVVARDGADDAARAHLANAMVTQCATLLSGLVPSNRASVK